MIVVDASVLAAALGDDGPHGRRSRARIESEELAGPEVLDLEVAAVLRGRLIGGQINSSRAARALTTLRTMDLRRFSHRHLLGRCWELRNNLTIYDASYVAVAELAGCVLLTSDPGLARSPSLRCDIELLPTN